MTEVWINDHVFGCCDFIIYSKLAGGRTEVVHQACLTRCFSLDSMSHVLVINVAEQCKYFVLICVLRITLTEIITQFNISTT